VLQCVAVCYSAWQRIAVVLQCVAVVLQCVAVRHLSLEPEIKIEYIAQFRDVAVCCSRVAVVLQYVAVCCSVLQCDT